MRTRSEALSLSELGWTAELQAHVPPGSSLVPARVASVYAARVDLWTPEGALLASLRSRALRDAPIEGGVAVGDWALVAPASEGASEVVVEAILPRKTVFLRQAAGERAEPQAIAANIARVLVVMAVDADFNLRRLERYLVAIAAGGAEALVVLTKADLCEDTDSMVSQVTPLAPVLATSSRTGLGLDELVRLVPSGTTAALVGSSGVGKSALVNRLLGRTAQREGEVRAYDGKGRHTTTRRELFVLPGAGLIIDTPGMRELKPWLPEGTESTDTFEDVLAFGEGCRYRDCSHQTEPGCAVRAAVERCELSKERFDAWQKLASERAELGSRQAGFAAKMNKRAGRARDDE